MKNFASHEDKRVRKAYEIALIAHYNQFDKGGIEYIQHPLTVASNVGENVSAIIVALLHDVAEDTNLTLDYLKTNIPLTNEETEALRLLIHKKEIPYFDYIAKIKFNELSRLVKIADLKHNLDLSRIKNPTQEDEERNKKYRTALQFLEA
ncbi:MAG: hypothetical protein K6G55_09300 [Selenomonadaceae bacterium]|nr:hypothetical protein [Selenomonadaceae bacterium]